MTPQYRHSPLCQVICTLYALCAVAAMAQPELVLSTDEAFSGPGIAPGQQEASMVDLTTGIWEHPPWVLAAALPPHVSINAIDEHHDGAIFFSLDTDVVLDGTLYADEDIIQWDGTAFSMAWDGSAWGVPPEVDLDALDVVDLVNFVVLCSFDSDVVLESYVSSGLYVLVADEDVAWFDDLGFFFTLLDMSTLGIPESADLDGLSTLAWDTDFLFSFGEDVVIGSELYDDSDVIHWQYGSGFATTPWFDASAFGIPPEVNLAAADDSPATPTGVPAELWSIYR
ncbi:hypothetical protein JXA47_16355 [Candidatus Sumerlaeota bacterium]|nr:hypothetical protein [Candidatus Sumerlaeota bacterium]